MNTVYYKIRTSSKRLCLSVVVWTLFNLNNQAVKLKKVFFYGDYGSTRISISDTITVGSEYLTFKLQTITISSPLTKYVVCNSDAQFLLLTGHLNNWKVVNHLNVGLKSGLVFKRWSEQWIIMWLGCFRPF